MNPTHRARRRVVAFGLLAGASVLAGCAGDLLPKPPAAPLRYTLDAGGAQPGGLPVNTSPGAAAGAQPGAPTLIVVPLVASAGYDSPRLVYLRQPQALEAYAFHEWADTPARLLAPLIVRALQQRGTFHAVLQGPSSGEAALRLETTLLRLHHDLTVPPGQLHLTLRAVLIDTTTRQPLAWREFDARVTTPMTGPVGAVAAAGVATQRVLDELASFVTTEAQRAAPARSR